MAAKTILNSFRLEGRVALVTGGTGRLGSAISKSLAGAGAHVMVNSHTSKLKFSGPNFTHVPFDVTDERAIRKWASKIKKDYGKLDILVHCAYQGKTGTLENATPDDFRNAYEVSVVSAFNLINAFKPLLERAAQKNLGGASVIHVASVYGTQSPDPSIYGKSGMNNPPHYGAAKAALLQFTRYAACHLARQKIRVNAISPGPFPPEEFLMRNSDFHAKLRKKVPIGRVGQPEELGGAVLFLASDASSFVTGVNLPVDGGWTAW